VKARAERKAGKAGAAAKKKLNGKHLNGKAANGAARKSA